MQTHIPDTLLQKERPDSGVYLAIANVTITFQSN